MRQSEVHCTMDNNPRPHTQGLTRLLGQNPRKFWMEVHLHGLSRLRRQPGIVSERGVGWCQGKKWGVRHVVFKALVHIYIILTCIPDANRDI